MIILLQTQSAGLGLIGLFEVFYRWFGRFWWIAWLACGLIGIAEMVEFARLFTPEMAEYPVDGVDWFLIGFMSVLFISGGPAAVPAPIFFALMFFICNETECGRALECSL